MKKYYFLEMEDSKYVKNNWFNIIESNSLTEEEIKNEKIIVNNIEYKIISLLELKDFMKNNPNYKLYKETVKFIDKETLDYITNNIKLN